MSEIIQPTPGYWEFIDAAASSMFDTIDSHTCGHSVAPVRTAVAVLRALHVCASSPSALAAELLALRDVESLDRTMVDGVLTDMAGVLASGAAHGEGDEYEYLHV